MLKDMIKKVGNDLTRTADDPKMFGNISSFIDTGSYLYNAVLSGSIYGGYPSNRVTTLAGESSTGKTYMALQGVKSFLEAHEDNFAVFFDVEGALTTSMLEKLGIDTQRFVNVPVATAEEWKSTCTKWLEEYNAQAPILEGGRKGEKDFSQPRMMFVLDSLGQLTTEKSEEDAMSDSSKRDMTKAVILNGAFSIITKKCSAYNVPFLVLNHVYDVIGAYMPTKAMPGGKGVRFASSNVVFLSKKTAREGTENTGNIITVTMNKSRFTKEKSRADILLSYKNGLDRWGGMLELAVSAGIIQQAGAWYVIPGHTAKKQRKWILENIEEVFTREVMDACDKHAGELYLLESDFIAPEKGVEIKDDKAEEDEEKS